MGAILAIVGAYLLGSIPFALIITKVSSGLDIRQHGSGNIGATNVGRIIGKGAGALTFFLDFLKGLLPVIGSTYLFHSELIICFAALFAVLGHMFPLYLRFRGGKGVATGFGAMVSIMPHAALTSFLLFILICIIWRYVSLGSVLSSFSLPFFGAYSGSPHLYVACSAVISILILIKHRENIQRIISGNEDKIGS